MLVSDGLDRRSFLPLWRDAMWHATEPLERARLVMELGRVSVREAGRAEPMAVAITPHAEPPLLIVPLDDLPSYADAPAVRERLVARLADLGATEVYLLATLVGARGPRGAASFLLTAWGETLRGEEVAWLRAYRFVGEALEEAPPLSAPDASMTELSRRCGGLLTPLH